MTTIHVKDEVWKKLNSLKEPGQSMNDVIERLLSVNESALKQLTSDNSISSSEEFDALLDDFISTISEDLIQKTIDLSRKSFSKEVSEK